ncbi:hypothetical protein OS493_029235 [Desmophyllum pertusum]|uniref:Uncharacterized protein n=1 Tax=Desmophyllum pertusum TaxID=174260 RepID=A0A9W9ZKT5_9CNID|nr:hypothetical protein OS493_029235 [Desmophyllum pertusum]
MKLLVSLLLLSLTVDPCWSQCRMANWWGSFDRKGWSVCGPSNEYMTGLYRNDHGGSSDKLYLLEEVKCYPPAPSQGPGPSPPPECSNYQYLGDETRARGYEGNSYRETNARPIHVRTELPVSIFKGIIAVNVNLDFLELIVKQIKMSARTIPARTELPVSISLEVIAVIANLDILAITAKQLFIKGRQATAKMMKLLVSLLLLSLTVDPCWSQCRMANWWGSFDRKGWSVCGPSNEYMTGLYRNGHGGSSDKLYLLEEVKCCKAPKPNENSQSTCSNVNWWKTLDS